MKRQHITALIVTILLTSTSITKVVSAQVTNKEETARLPIQQEVIPVKADSDKKVILLDIKKKFEITRKDLQDILSEIEENEKYARELTDRAYDIRENIKDINNIMTKLEKENVVVEEANGHLLEFTELCNIYKKDFVEYKMKSEQEVKSIKERVELPVQPEVKEVTQEPNKESSLQVKKKNVKKRAETIIRGLQDILSEIEGNKKYAEELAYRVNGIRGNIEDINSVITECENGDLVVREANEYLDAYDKYYDGCKKDFDEYKMKIEKDRQALFNIKKRAENTKKELQDVVSKIEGNEKYAGLMYKVNEIKTSIGDIEQFISEFQNENLEIGETESYLQIFIRYRDRIATLLPEEKLTPVVEEAELPVQPEIILVSDSSNKESTLDVKKRNVKKRAEAIIRGLQDISSEIQRNRKYAMELVDTSQSIKENIKDINSIITDSENGILVVREANRYLDTYTTYYDKCKKTFLEYKMKIKKDKEAILNGKNSVEAIRKELQDIVSEIQGNEKYAKELGGKVDHIKSVIGDMEHFLNNTNESQDLNPELVKVYVDSFIKASDNIKKTFGEYKMKNF